MAKGTDVQDFRLRRNRIAWAEALGIDPVRDTEGPVGVTTLDGQAAIGLAHGPDGIVRGQPVVFKSEPALVLTARLATRLGFGQLTVEVESNVVLYQNGRDAASGVSQRGCLSIFELD